jgi:hypothetical protein
MQPLIEEQPQPGQKLTGLRRPHEQFVYGCTHACPSKARSVLLSLRFHLHRVGVAPCADSAHAVLLQNACDAISCAHTMFTLPLPCTFMSYVMCVRVCLQGIGKTRRRRPRRGICCTCITTSAWYFRSTAMTELTARATANHSMGRSLPTERWCDESRAMGTFLSSLLPSCCLLCVSLDGAAQR